MRNHRPFLHTREIDIFNCDRNSSRNRPASQTSAMTMGKRREKSKPVHEPREDLLSALVHGCLGEFPDRRHLLYRAELAGLAMRRWIANSKLTANQSDKRLRVLRDRDYQLSAVATIASEQNPGPEPACLRIGQAGTADFSELRPLAERAAELLGMSRSSAHVLIQSARRVPVENSPGAKRFGHAQERPPLLGSIALMRSRASGNSSLCHAHRP